LIFWMHGAHCLTGVCLKTPRRCEVYRLIIGQMNLAYSHTLR
jgi:hypothetical protein